MLVDALRKIVDAMRFFDQHGKQHPQQRAALIAQMPQRLCLQCGGFVNESYMVCDEVWLEAVPEGKGQLHFHCLEKRLKRFVTLEDFQSLPVNTELFYGYIIARREAGDFDHPP